MPGGAGGGEVACARLPLEAVRHPHARGGACARLAGPHTGRWLPPASAATGQTPCRATLCRVKGGREGKGVGEGGAHCRGRRAQGQQGSLQPRQYPRRRTRSALPTCRAAGCPAPHTSRRSRAGQQRRRQLQQPQRRSLPPLPPLLLHPPQPRRPRLRRRGGAQRSAPRGPPPAPPAAAALPPARGCTRKGWGRGLGKTEAGLEISYSYRRTEGGKQQQQGALVTSGGPRLHGQVPPLTMANAGHRPDFDAGVGAVLVGVRVLLTQPVLGEKIGGGGETVRCAWGTGRAVQTTLWAA